jgi:hypothetical protein
VLKDLENFTSFRPASVRLVKFVFAYLLVTHMLAATYWFVAASAPADADACDGARAAAFAAWSVCPALLESASLFTQWLYAFHWVLLSLGGETMGAATPLEHAVSAAIILCGHIVNSVVIGSCASLLLSLDHNETLRQQQKDVIAGVMDYHHVPRPLAAKVRSFYEYMWEWGHRNKDSSVFDDLPAKLHHQLNVVKHDALVSAHHLFDDVAPHCTIAVIERLATRLATPAEYVIVQNGVGDDLFLISRGRVQVTRVDDALQETPVAQIGEGSFFGARVRARAPTAASAVAPPRHCAAAPHRRPPAPPSPPLPASRASSHTPPRPPHAPLRRRRDGAALADAPAHRLRAHARLLRVPHAGRRGVPRDRYRLPRAARGGRRRRRRAPQGVAQAQRPGRRRSQTALHVAVRLAQARDQQGDPPGAGARAGAVAGAAGCDRTGQARSAQPPEDVERPERGCGRVAHNFGVAHTSGQELGSLPPRGTLRHSRGSVN